VAAPTPYRPRLQSETDTFSKVDEPRSQRLRRVNFQGDALRMGMNWTEKDQPDDLVGYRGHAAR
jgi:hypothetical protein